VSGGERPDPDTEALVSAFVDRTLPRGSWTHESHLRVGLWHVQTLGEAAAAEALRERIRRYNDSVGTPNTDISGYHETLTLFYVRLIADFVAGCRLKGDRPEDQEARLLAELGRRELPLEYYSHARLFSTEARRHWLPPDLRPLP